MKNHPVAYCLHCKKFFNEDLTDGNGWICCPECKGGYQFNIMQLKSYDKEGYTIEIQDELIINFRDQKHFDSIIKKMQKLINKSKEV